MDHIRKKRIYDGKIVHLAVFNIQLPDGSTAERELIEHRGAVAVVALTTNQQVILVRQYRVGAGRALYEIPAGLLEPDESPEACAARELREEIGYRPGSLEALGGLYTAPGYTTEYIHLFLAQDLIHAPLAQDHDEFIEVVQMPLREAIHQIEKGEIADSKTVIGLLKVARRFGL